MIPDLPNLSNPVMSADFVSPHNGNKTPLVDYARGGEALLDASRGLDVKDWKCELVDSGVYISAYGVPAYRIETIADNPRWISFAFDQNMHYNLTYTTGVGSFLYWYDALQGEYVTDALGNVSTPFLRMDDVTKPAFADCELVLSYIKGGVLCVRVQRDRFGVEYTLATSAGSSIQQCGMNKKRRFQWMCV